MSSTADQPKIPGLSLLLAIAIIQELEHLPVDFIEYEDGSGYKFNYGLVSPDPSLQSERKFISLYHVAQALPQVSVPSSLRHIAHHKSSNVG